MPKISVDQLQPGMVLAEDLNTESGRMLLPAGATLTAAHIQTCRVWDIEAAMIHGDDTPIQSASLRDLDPVVRKACMALAERRFRLNNPRHPAVRRMSDLYILRTAKGMSRDDAEALRAKLEANPLPEPQPIQSHQLVLEEIIDQELELASLPDIFQHIKKAIDDPRSSADFLAEVISKDVSVSAKLLKMVNTPFFGFPSRIDTLSRAVTIMGTDQLASLALGISIISVFKNIPETHFSLKGFWLHSITTGIIARHLAKHFGIDDDERFFVAGLLHDIGQLVMLKNRPAAAANMLDQSKTQDLSLFEVERKIWGFSHGRVGGMMLKAWKLPLFLWLMARDHHSPGRSEMDTAAAIIHVADFMTHALGMGAGATQPVTVLDTEAWAKVTISKDRLSEIAQLAQRQADDIMLAFFPGG